MADYQIEEFFVRTIDDPTRFLPERIILGISKCGAHFLLPVSRKHLRSAELREIKQFGSCNTSVYLEMRVDGDLHLFQFETKQGEEICVALQTHINEVVLRRDSKAPSATTNITPSTNQVLNKIQEELKVRTLELRAANETIKRLVIEKMVLEDRNLRLEEKKSDDIQNFEKSFEQECKSLKLRVSELEKELEEVKQNLSVAESTLAVKETELSTLHVNV